jgi:hypothetical protein
VLAAADPAGELNSMILTRIIHDALVMADIDA